MGCTTILVGKKASNDGSTMIARTDDSGSGNFEAKRFVVVAPENQPRTYVSTQSHVTVKLPDDPMAYTCMPDAVQHKGIWPNAGINAVGVAMSATETLTSNERVLAADPLVELVPARGTEGDADYEPERPGGIGEEDLVLLVLPYIRTAREGVTRLGTLLEEYGTYEMNGIAFGDADEIWWLETIGGHHWMARRLPDDSYAIIPNQLGLDEFDIDDAFGEQHNYMCSADMREFIADNHLDLGTGGAFNPRHAFGSHSDSDHTYNTPRAWGLQRYFNPRSNVWDGPGADYTPMSDDLPGAACRNTRFRWKKSSTRWPTTTRAPSLIRTHATGLIAASTGRLGLTGRRRWAGLTCALAPNRCTGLRSVLCRLMPWCRSMLE